MHHPRKAEVVCERVIRTFFRSSFPCFYVALLTMYIFLNKIFDNSPLHPVTRSLQKYRQLILVQQKSFLTQADDMHCVGHNTVLTLLPEVSPPIR